MTDTTKSIQGIQISDSDSTNLTVTFTHSAGILSIPTNVVNGLSSSGVSGSGTATLTLTGSVAQINATLAASSGLIYTPTTGFSGNATLTMTTDDGVGGIDTDTISMTVTGNVAPVGVDATVTMIEDGSYTFNASDFGYSDGDNNSLAAVKITTLPTNGVLKLGTTPITTAGTEVLAADIANLSFTPAPNANGSTNFTFQVRDSSGALNDLDLSPNTFTINVTPVNDAPTLSSQSLAVTERGVIDGTTTSGLLVGVNDPENDPVTITSVSFKKLATVLDTSFNESVLDSLIHLDVPNSAKGNIVLDPIRGELDFTAANNTDMWGGRADAPIAWVDTPDVPTGGKWSFETQVRIDQRHEGTVVSGITFYNDDGGLPDFTFGINNWDGGYIHVQQLAGGRNKQFSDLGDLNSSYTPTNPDGSTSAFLKVEVVEQG
jgi:hypothetical protein